jgi:hypothetical protein
VREPTKNKKKGRQQSSRYAPKHCDKMEKLLWVARNGHEATGRLLLETRGELGVVVPTNASLKRT